jgi:hypothetical protein
MELKIILLFLPPNATHLVQPLDICVFAPFKRAIRDGIHDYMVENGIFVFLYVMFIYVYVFYTLCIHTVYAFLFQC